MNDKITADESFLAVYNIYEGPDRHLDWYTQCLEGLLEQDYKDYQIVVSGCRVSEETKQGLRKRFGSRMWYNFIPDRYTVHITMNKTVDLVTSTIRDYDGYLYIDSGMDCRGIPNILTEINARSRTKKYGMLSVQPDSDSGFDQSSPLTRNRGPDVWGQKQPPLTEDLEIRVSYVCNLHFRYFKNDIRLMYGKIFPDVLIWNMEGYMSYLNAALHLKEAIIKDIYVPHLMGPYLDRTHDSVQGDNQELYVGESAATRRKPQHARLMFDLDFEKVVKNDYSKSLGMGMCRYDFSANFIPDPDLYDENGFAKHSHLKFYIRDNLYMKKEFFDYTTMKSDFFTD